MKIDTSTVFMDSGRFYENTTLSGRNTSSGRIGRTNSYISASFASEYMRFGKYAGSNHENQYDSLDLSSSDNDEYEYLGSDLYSSFYRGPLGITSVKNNIQDFHEKLIEQIEELMERIKAQLLGRPYEPQSKNESVLDLTTSSTRPGNLWVRQGFSEAFYEAETTTFSSVGKITTADGRSIDFNIDLLMSRSFTRTVPAINEGLAYMLTDPLVINLEDFPETISDQKWFFDLNGDGELEEMSQLAKGNAFLALDRDGNGNIDNGTELFGAVTGNGFAELSEFDEDGNGWIDENDPIFDQLKVWRKDSAGNDVLTGLRNSDIGAIYLGAVNTQFSHNNLYSNETEAQVRQTGFFLHESTGSAGLLQQVDFATRKAAS